MTGWGSNGPVPYHISPAFQATTTFPEDYRGLEHLFHAVEYLFQTVETSKSPLFVASPATL
jgi:hypothetical protein